MTTPLPPTGILPLPPPTDNIDSTSTVCNHALLGWDTAIATCTSTNTNHTGPSLTITIAKQKTSNGQLKHQPPRTTALTTTTTITYHDSDNEYNDRAMTALTAMHWFFLMFVAANYVDVAAAADV